MGTPLLPRLDRPAREAFAFQSFLDEVDDLLIAVLSIALLGEETSQEGCGEGERQDKRGCR
jgi:hypothetical protein